MVELAMFSHVTGDDEWKELPLSECLAMVQSGKARECFMCEYDDSMRSFHCTEPCTQCDTDEGLERAPTHIND